jgi:hypothetical protein
VNSVDEVSRATPVTPSTLPAILARESMPAAIVAKPIAPAQSPKSVNGPTRASSSGIASCAHTGRLPNGSLITATYRYVLEY